MFSCDISYPNPWKHFYRLRIAITLVLLAGIALKKLLNRIEGYYGEMKFLSALRRNYFEFCVVEIVFDPEKQKPAGMNDEKIQWRRMVFSQLGRHNTNRVMHWRSDFRTNYPEWCGHSLSLSPLLRMANIFQPLFYSSDWFEWMEPHTRGVLKQCHYYVIGVYYRCLSSKWKLESIRDALNSGLNTQLWGAPSRKLFFLGSLSVVFAPCL